MPDYYYEKQLRFYEKAPCEAAKDDALYRLGCHLQIIPPDATVDSLTAEERETVLDAIKDKGDSK